MYNSNSSAVVNSASALSLLYRDSAQKKNHRSKKSNYNQRSLNPVRLTKNQQRAQHCHVNYFVEVLYEEGMLQFFCSYCKIHGASQLVQCGCNNLIDFYFKRLMGPKLLHDYITRTLQSSEKIGQNEKIKKKYNTFP